MFGQMYHFYLPSTQTDVQEATALSAIIGMNSAAFFILRDKQHAPRPQKKAPNEK